MHETDLHLEPNEASDLTVVNVAKPGYDRTMLTVLDEANAEGALALLVHREGLPLDDGWEVLRVNARPSTGAGKTEDAEACATRDGYAYLLGSQFGKKAGPLSARRSWIARLPEHDLVHAPEPTLEIARLRFGLHRAVNDALRPFPLLPLGPLGRERYIDATIERGREKRWNGRVQPGDQPINVEAMEFTEAGTLLLGLRYPVTAAGHPLLVEILHPERLFEDPDALPQADRVWWLENIGDREAPVGFRALDTATSAVFDAVVGDLDAANKSATVLEDHPQGGKAESSHVRFTLPAASGAITAETVHRFGDIRRVEGVAIDHEGHAHFVIDEEGHVALRTLIVE